MIETKPQNIHNRDYLAAAVISLGALCYTSGFIVANEHKWHPITNALARGVALAVLTYSYSRQPFLNLGTVSFYCSYKKIDLTFPLESNFRWQVVRNAIIILQGLCFSWAQFYMPLPVAFTINATNPLFVAVFDYWVYGVRLNRRQVGWLGTAFLGVVLIVNGDELMGWGGGQRSSGFKNYMSKESWVVVAFEVLLVLTTAMLGLGVVITKKLKSTNAFQINYFQGLMVLFISSLFIPNAFEDMQYHKPSMTQLGWAVLLTGVPTAVGGICYIFALTITQNYAMITPFQFTGVFVSYFVSILRYGEEVNWVCVGGTVLIAVGVVALIRAKDRQGSQEDERK